MNVIGLVCYSMFYRIPVQHSQQMQLISVGLSFWRCDAAGALRKLLGNAAVHANVWPYVVSLEQLVANASIELQNATVTCKCDPIYNAGNV